jgi:HEXXH motif-containing protein
MSETDRSPSAGVDLPELFEEAFHGFSCPQKERDESFLTHVVTEYARNVMRFFVDKYEVQLGKCSRGLVDLFTEALAPGGVQEIAWDPAFGGTYWAIQAADHSEVALIAASLALHLGAYGMQGQWDVTLRQPVHLRWDQWLLPLADHIIVRCEGNVAHIRTSLANSHQETIFVRLQEGWQADGTERLPHFGIHGRRITLLPQRALMLKDFKELVSTAVEVIEPQTVADLQSAIELLHHHAPVYLPWVQRVVRCVFLIQPRIKTIISGSLDHYFGLIHITPYPEPAAVAELLVHEASHQYFNLLCLLGPFDDGTDTTQYYSPAVRRNRPLDRIGIAYHAFANILLFYRLCLGSGIVDGGYCSRMIARVTAEVEQLQRPLRNNLALTPIGRALCRPLIECV